MASPNVYPNGVGGTTGAELATVSPLLMSGEVWYVSTTGTDAAAPRGKDRARPLATVGQAITNAAAGDIIVVLSGYSASVSATITVSKALTIVGEGSGTSRPRFTRSSTSPVFDLTAADVVLWNLYFPAATATSASAKVKASETRQHFRDCYFECGAFDTTPALDLTAASGHARIENTTFISTATDVTAQAESAIKVSSGHSNLVLDTVVFDGGTTGWSNPFAFNGAGAITTFRAINVDLLNDSDMTLATGTTGYVNVRNTSGSARVIWAA